MVSVDIKQYWVVLMRHWSQLVPNRVICQLTYILYILYWSLLYSTIFRSWANSLHSHVILHVWTAFYSAFLNIHRSGVLTVLAWLVPQESAARESQSRRVLCTPYNVSLHLKCILHLDQTYHNACSILEVSAIQYLQIILSFCCLFFKLMQHWLLFSSCSVATPDLSQSWFEK